MAMEGSDFPKIRAKHTFTAMVTAERYMKRKAHLRPKGMATAVFVYSDKILRYMTRELGLKKTDMPYKGYLRAYESKARGVIVLRLSIGAPLTAATVDELACWGIKNFYIMGSAGSLSKRAPYNSIVVCSKAVRDEGTSHHYVKPSLFAYPSKALMVKAKEAVKAAGMGCLIGPSWTIDAPYRETFEEVRHYRNIGVLTVEMEASAMFAVASLLDAKSCAIFSISDVLYEEWSGFLPRRISGYRNLAKVAAKLFPARRAA
jgi:uridine phosphorylase